MSLSPKARLIRDWVSSEWTEKLCAVYEAITDEKPVSAPPGSSPDATEPGENALVWQQKISLFLEPVLWVAAPVETCVELGRRVLASSGIDNIEEADAQNTFLELLSQSLAALSEAFSSHLRVSAAIGDGEQIDTAPRATEWTPVGLQLNGLDVQPLWISASAALLERLAEGQKSGEARSDMAVPAPDSASHAPQAPPVPSVASKTFDLLLDVAMPVSISFGRTYLPIKDVLKLTTGSIVELDRAINEPVDVIVNNCVIARGEVVVVEGNYGVRIHQIASRTDRLRTGTAATQVKHATAGD